LFGVLLISVERDQKARGNKRNRRNEEKSAGNGTYKGDNSDMVGTRRAKGKGEKGEKL